ncbi:MAG: hypothetical protein IH946_05305 [Bacteroidetes bacterium]|nr:hypothetical protein [Bacteroidota bacterium]
MKSIHLLLPVILFIFASCSNETDSDESNGSETTFEEQTGPIEYPELEGLTKEQVELMMQNLDDYCQALTENDLEKSLAYIYPKVVEMAVNKLGITKEEYLKKVLEARTKTQAMGIKMLAYSFDSPRQPLIFDGSIYTVIDGTVKFMQKEIEREIPTQMIAISKDQGNSWYYLKKDQSYLEILQDELPEELLQQL